MDISNFIKEIKKINLTKEIEFCHRSMQNYFNKFVNFLI